jgi:hypothetical protein
VRAGQTDRQPEKKIVGNLSTTAGCCCVYTYHCEGVAVMIMQAKRVSTSTSESSNQETNHQLAVTVTGRILFGGQDFQGHFTEMNIIIIIIHSC